MESGECKGVHWAGNCLASNPWLKFNSKMPLKSYQNPIGSRIVFRKHHFFEGLLLLNYRGVWLKTSTHYNYGPYKF